MTRIPPSTHRRRRSDGSARAVLLVAVAVATVLSLVPAPASAAPRDSEGVRAGRMFVMSVPGLTWTEIERYDLPNLAAFFATAGLADLAPRGVSARSGPGDAYRSEERRVGKECVRPCRYRGSPHP